MRYLLLGLIAASAPVYAQGPLIPPGPPGPTQKSLQEIWDRISTLESIVVGQQQQIAQLQQHNSILLAAGNVSLPWTYETVYIDLPLGKMSLAFAPSGQPSIAYCDEDTSFIKYALRSTAGWTVTTVDLHGGSDAHPSLAFSPAGLPMIAYHRSGDDTGLSVARFNGSSWTIDNVDGGDTGYHPILVFSPSGFPAIAYDDTEDNGIGYAHAAAGEGSWDSSTIPSPDATRPSLAFDTSGQPAIAYQTGVTVLHLSRMVESSWVTSTIAEDPDGFLEYTDICLAFSPTGQPAVSYDSYFSEGRLNYAVLDDQDDWQTSMVTQGSDWGFNSTLRFSPSGQPTISHTPDVDTDGYDSNIAVATLKAAVWEKEYLGVNNADRYDSGQLKLTFTRGGQPAVVFSNGSSIRYAVKGAFQ